MRGFIGQNLKEYLSNFNNYELLTPSRAELDLLKETEVKLYLNTNRPDVIINSAICRNPKYFPNINLNSELEQDLRMFYILEKYSSLYGKLFYFGSGAEFDKRANISLVKEDSFINDIPATEYGLAKYIIGKAIESSDNIYNLRLFGLFGKYENWKTTFISGACCKALKGIPITIRRNVVFDYLYIDDFCSIIKWFIDNEPKHHTYNIASGTQIDLLTIANKVKQISGADVPVFICEPGWGNEYTADTSRLISEFTQFKPMAIEKSIEDLLGYYKSVLDFIDLTSLLYQ